MVASDLAGSGLSQVGLGKVYGLNNFGWNGAGDIGRAWQAAVDAAAYEGAGAILLPAGQLYCDRNVDIPPSSFGPDPNQTSITLSGQGYKSTIINFASGTEGVRFMGTASSGGNYVNGPSIRDMTLRMYGGARGLVFHETLFANATNVHVYGASGYAVDITDGGN